MSSLSLLVVCVCFSYADIKGFLVDVKPALLTALDAEYEKNPYEVYMIAAAHFSDAFQWIPAVLTCHASGCFCSYKEDC